MFHKLGNLHVLYAVVSSDSSGNPVARSCGPEEGEHRGSSVVVVDPKASNETRFTVDKSVSEKFPAHETYSEGKDMV
jgi:hypothetical protein